MKKVKNIYMMKYHKREAVNNIIILQRRFSKILKEGIRILLDLCKKYEDQLSTNL